MTLALPLPGLKTSTSRGVHIPHHKFRVLLALDSSRLSSQLLSAALARCVSMTDRLDILLVNPPKPPTSLLSGLLLRLEHSGIDYRLASSEGDLGEQILQYLDRFKGITWVLVDKLTPLQQSIGASMAQLCMKGYRFDPIVEPTQG